MESDSQNTDYYKVLEVERTASEDEIKKARNRLLHTYHPDRNAGWLEDAKKKTIAITEASQVLLNKESRREYDIKLAQIEKRRFEEENRRKEKEAIRLVEELRRNEEERERKREAEARRSAEETRRQEEEKRREREAKARRMIEDIQKEEIDWNQILEEETRRRTEIEYHKLKRREFDRAVRAEKQGSCIGSLVQIALIVAIFWYPVKWGWPIIKWIWHAIHSCCFGTATLFVCFIFLYRYLFC